jgi:multidrug resistance efflux pump
MSQAHVASIEGLASWKDALGVFAAEGRDALVAVELEIRRTMDWLDSQLKLWQVEIRKAEELVHQARTELNRRKMLPIMGRPPDCTEQEKALRRAQARLAHAEEKLETCRRWVPRLRQAVEEYQGTARPLTGWLEHDLPRACAVLEQRIAALKAYVGTAPPPGTGPG